jgi:exopolysaccharide biosynthesis polyprenyl glycosylphosphotransferase
MFQRDRERLRRGVMVLDALATAACVLVAYGMREVSIGETDTLLAYMALVPPLMAVMIFTLALTGAYNAPLATPTWRMVGAVSSGVALAVAAIVLVIFSLKLYFVSRMVIFTFAILDTAALVGIRLVSRHLLRSPDLRRRILVVGTGERARRAVDAWSAPAGCEVVGCVDIVQRRAVGDHGPVVSGATVGEIAGILESQVVDEVVLAVPRSMLHATQAVVLAAETEGVRVRVMADLFEPAPKRVSIDHWGTVPFLTLDWLAHDDSKVLAKRLIDVVLAGTALVVLAPLLAITALAIKLDSKGPVLFIQPRVGRHKRTFRLMKFRTMCADAELRQASLEMLNEARGPVFKIATDPRVTRVGRWLRRTSIDELPQLWNVLWGDMSLVGPRPLPLRDVRRFHQAVQRKRFSVKPGLTCLWQISGRSTLSFDEWLRLDLWYIDHWSLTLDLKLILRTVPAVIRGTGAS